MTLGLCCLLLLAFQDEGEIVSNEIDAFATADRFYEAHEMFNSVQRIESEPLFEQIIADLETREELNTEEREIMTESLKCMGVINYPDETEAYFEKLIRFEPGYDLNSKDLSPKIVNLFDELKAQLVGSVRVLAVDAASGKNLEQASFWVDGKEIGPVFGEIVFPVFNGLRQVEVRCPNYETRGDEIMVTASEETFIRGDLIRNASQVDLVTVPGGVRILLNGNEMGVSDSEIPRGKGFETKLREMGVQISDAGALILNNIETGNYRLTLEKPCFKTVTFGLNVPEPDAITPVPMKLEPASASLNVSAVGENSGLVFLDKQRVDFLPVKDFQVCPGEYELRVRFTDGEYIKKLVLEDGDVATLLAEPLPSIAWFGLQDEDEGKPPGDMDAWVTELKGWNVRSIDPNDTTRVPINPFPILFAGENITDEGKRSLTSQVTADLYMAARVRRKVLIRNVEVVFWTPLSKRIFVKTFDFREFDKFKEMLTRLDANPTTTMPWLGVQVARVRDRQGCKVIEVHPNGPMAGVTQPGDYILGMEGEPLRGPERIVGLNSMEPISVTLNSGETSITPIATIVEVPFEPDVIAPQATLARLEKLARYHPDELTRQSAKFNQARFQLHLGDFQQAYDIFSTMTIDTPYGINQGTLYFYQALCFRRLRLVSETNTAFRAVLQYPQGTLFNAYGPKVAHWAETELLNPDL